MKPPEFKKDFRPLTSLAAAGSLAAGSVLGCSPETESTSEIDHLAEVRADAGSTEVAEPEPSPAATVVIVTPGAGGSSPEPGGEEVLVGPEEGETEPVLEEETACEAVAEQATVSLRPMDIVLVIDNSYSMREEIEAALRNVNVNFAQILDESQIDYRVVQFSSYDSPALNLLNVCVEPPLGPTECAARSEADSPHRPDRFFAFTQPIESDNGFCVMQQTSDQAPSWGTGLNGNGPSITEDDPLLQNGWLPLLRQEAFKSFLVLSDDDILCEGENFRYRTGNPRGYAVEDSAEAFDRWLQETAPEHFGASPEERNYAWHSIVGVAANDPVDKVYEATDPFVINQCPTAVTAGDVHQALSRLSGGLRYPVCNHESYDAVFTRLAEYVVDRALLPCSYDIPPAPDGEMFDRDRVNVAFYPEEGQAPDLGRVEGLDQCEDLLGWYYDDNEAPGAVHMCPESCALLEGDDLGRVEILFGCETRQPTVR